MKKTPVEPALIIKALTALLIEKNIITGKELREMIQHAIIHEGEKADKDLR